MALRLALVVDGDPSGAKKALEETAKGVETLKKGAEGAAQPVEAIGGGLREAADEAPRAAEGITKVADAADVAGGKLGSFRSGLIGVGAGLVGGIGVAAAGEAFEPRTWGGARFLRGNPVEHADGRA
jgi:hypothetical protein